MHSSRFASLVAVFAASGMLFVSTGCGKSKAAKAQEPPPQTLSEPVRPEVASAAPAESVPLGEPKEEPRAIPVTSRNENMRVGESRTLPSFDSPAPAAVVAPPAPKEALVFENPGSKGNNYHTLQKGETLSAVSRKYNVSLRKIIESNHFKDPNKLPVGTKVYIP